MKMYEFASGCNRSCFVAMTAKEEGVGGVGGGVGVRGTALVTACSVSSRLSAQTLGPEVCSGSSHEVTQGHAHKGA